MPALVKSRVGSWAGINEDDRTMVCPLASKYWRKRRRRSFPVIMRTSDPRLYAVVGVRSPPGFASDEGCDHTSDEHSGITAAEEIAGEPGRRAVGGSPKQRGQPSAPGLESPIEFRRFFEGSFDRSRRQP